MMTRRRIVALLSFGILLTSWSWRGRDAAAEPSASGAPGARQEVTGGPGPGETPAFENDRVRVVRMHLAPYEKIPMHLLPPHLVIWLTGARLKMTAPDGNSSETRFSAGQAIWVAAEKHAGENLTDEPIDFLAIFLKSSGKPATGPGE